jgi:hypothetical protein
VQSSGEKIENYEVGIYQVCGDKSVDTGWIPVEKYFL